MLDTVAKTYRVAFVGNPNCGKTALFNALTGSRQKVANYPGVTVERKEGQLITPGGKTVTVIDLPGTYSLRGRSPDEVVTRDAVLGKLRNFERPDLLVCVADATNLRLILRLVLEVSSTGLPMILALNMSDIAENRGIRVDAEGLSRELGIPVVRSVAVSRAGVSELLGELDTALTAARHGTASAMTWAERGADEIRQAHRLADQMVARFVNTPDIPRDMSSRIDKVLLHPVAGILILLAVLFFVFQAVYTWAGPPMDMISDGFDALAATVQETLPEGLLASLLTDGIITGVGSVLVFLPQIVILFFFIILLEDSGYMARAAFLTDRIVGGAGLHGRSFIPLLSSFACAIPGVMATRVIENRRQRLATIMVAPLMTCSARIPVYTLLIGAFVPRSTVGGFIDLQGLVLFSLYLAGIVSAFVVALVFRTFVWRGKTEPFIMELPGYKLPMLRSVAMGVFQRAMMFVRRAGTLILSMMILIWFLSTFPGAPEGATDAAINYSFAGIIGHAIEPVLAPIGFNWQIAVALIPGMAAREVAVGALATVYAVGGTALDEVSLGATIAAQWPLATALSLLAWYVFAPQCAPTLAVVRRETNSWRWPVLMFVYMMTLAYTASFVVYRTATYLGG
ncbi:ferrous iron transport protein B [Hoeflea olei]|uniref:Ferrous iron transport protein B n=1 Tax=Hoeflea olei TaxID=1480615 RepID=A0A1C1YVG4_9HYPH|nr:ferrous iron transport protein B [Hoeflea olei]OCW57522.1 ferrous iron transporter B [Hoeflea olei]